MENNFQVISAAVSDRGLSEKRPQNEDSYLEQASQGVFAVADGVGGAQAGDVASQMAVEILGEAFANQPAEIDAEEVMRIALDRANSAIFQMAADLPQLSSMATTIAALHVSGNIATIGHVGDSRVYRIDRDGLMHRETDDHSVVEEEVRAGRMTPEQALNHPSRNVISRALGAESSVEVDLKTIMVDPGTKFLLCSDGITRHINDSELNELLASDFEPSDLCERLKEICYDRGAEDNLTAVVVNISPEIVANYASNGSGVEHEAEEVTIASARSAFEHTAADEETIDTNLSEITPVDENGYEFTPAASDEAVAERAEDTDEPYLMAEEKSSAAVPLESYASERMVVPAQVPSVTKEKLRPAVAAPVIEDQKSGEGALGKVLSALLFLALGALIGAGIYYLVVPKPEPVQVQQAPVITEMKSNNTALTSFEEGRRQVDSDPQKYVDAKAASPQEAEDYFLLGRAFLLTGKYWEAKRSFTEARNRLAQVGDNNANTLAAEIAMALAIIESPQATETFQRDIATAKAARTGAANTNAAPVNTAPVDILVPDR